MSTPPSSHWKRARRSTSSLSLWLMNLVSSIVWQASLPGEVRLRHTASKDFCKPPSELHSHMMVLGTC